MALLVKTFSAKTKHYVMHAIQGHATTFKTRDDGVRDIRATAADLERVPSNDLCQDGSCHNDPPGILRVGAALGSHVHGSMDPNKKCCITGILPRTSPVAMERLHVSESSTILVSRVCLT